MYNSKLIQYLSHFSNKDLKRFREFVRSPYFNQHQKTIELLELIFLAPDWKSPQLKKTEIFHSLFPNKKYSEQNLRTVMSYLVQLIERFCTQSQWESQSEPLVSLLENALSNQQEKMFISTATKLQKRIDDQSIRNSHFHWQVSKFHHLQDTYNLQYGNRKSGEYLAKAIDHFDLYYLSEKLRMTCEMLARKQVTGQNYSNRFAIDFVAYIDQNPIAFKDASLVWMYYLVYKMLSTKETIFFFQLKEKLKTEIQYFPHQEGRDFYTHALNFCIGQINTGAQSFRKETFELYQEMLTQGLLYVADELPPWDYTNIVSLGCELEEKNWTQQFIQEQKEFLPHGTQENTYTYNLAAFHYTYQNYETALVLLQKLEFTDQYYNLLNRILLLKIYFETHDWRTLEYSLETFRIYLLRNKMEQNRRKSGLNLLKYTRQLSKLIDGQSNASNQDLNSKLVKLNDQMETNRFVLNKTWLIKQVTSFIKSREDGN